ncbi:LysR substrate-binding domain-containing protein [Ruegeria sp. Ofav3-42]|uniref:LysR substrate-binding domain-containing protein n=1 Tax=Ruegeria sp. Ofav3-42 TaxID=2917759 RepID=UPI001EF6ECEF|nr:LysR substrate-binding domain-containing protein [Ruegeria sp. Ofav3-42]MCG7521423.1 LysR substrate-binding domain-containing protein [Ruegeria sp. Ofav3-42]
MNIRQLRYFISIVDQGSVSSAARVLHIAQPALSQHIANLEEELTTELLVRSSRGVKPTKAGEVLYHHARKIVAQLKQATDDVRKEADTPRGEVSIVLPPMLGIHVAPLLLERVAEKYPEVELRIMEELALTVKEMIENGRVDLGILATREKATRAEYLHLYTEPLYLVSRHRAGEKPCSGTETVDVEALFTVPLVLSQQTHAVREIVEDVAEKKGRALNLRVTTESARLRLSYIRSGVTSGVLPWPSLDALWRRGEISAKRLVNPDLIRDIYLAWPRNQPLNAASRAVRQEMLDICHELFDHGVIRGTFRHVRTDDQNP